MPLYQCAVPLINSIANYAGKIALASLLGKPIHIHLPTKIIGPQCTGIFLYIAGIIRGESCVQHGGSREKHETEIKRVVIKRSSGAGMQ